MTNEASSSSSSPSRPWKYDVFLSFRGEDTRKNFTGHLYNALMRCGIHTFIDSKELIIGENISSELVDAIEGSRTAIVVFSQNYASSRWCLDELVKILECKKSGLMVLPVFYHVDPSDVRHQKNIYKEAIMKHEKRCGKEKLESWKAALTEAANLSGLDVANDANGHEAMFVKIIVEKLLAIVNETHFNVAKYPVGLVSHIERICKFLDEGMDVVRFVGIYGLPGIGKTTIAKAVFNDWFRKFEGSTFLPNVREDSRKQNGLALLQKNLLCGALNKKQQDISIDHEDRGMIIIKKRLCSKRVLIVLDDVDEMKQLDKLVGEHDWFGPGSRIIILTRDQNLLNIPEVDYKYKVETMNYNKSLQLFSFHAFRQDHPLEGYMKLSKYVVEYAGGLPLALVILGSILLTKKRLVEWESELEKLRKLLNKDIFQILELSYQSLDDFNRSIFLDITCFFIREDKDKVITILDASGLCPETGIELLIERSLVTIDENNKLCMHDLIRDMGREIIRKQSPWKPGGRSRLWQHTDAFDVLRYCTGTDAVEGLQLDLSMMEGERFQLTTNTFSKMPNLRLLRIGYSRFKQNSHTDWELCTQNKKRKFFDWLFYQKDWDLIFRNLVWVCWGGFPFEYLPNNFDLGNLVILDMKCSTKLKQVCKRNMHLPKLKVLDLSWSINLTCTPDFSRAPNLEKLILTGCGDLVEVDESIGQLSKLVKLDLSYCSKLRNLPSGIAKLTSLEKLDISHCYQLGTLPEGIGNLTSLNVLRVTHSMDIGSME